jgi:hypothetical protein
MDFKLFLILALIAMSSTQLNDNDKSIIKNTLLTLQDESSGLFNKNIVDTYKAVFSLTSINISISNIPRICKELSFEFEHGKPKIELVLLNKHLNCKLSISNKQDEVDHLNMKDIYDKVIIDNLLEKKYDYEATFGKLKNFMTEDNNFSNAKGDTSYSLKSTGMGLDIMTKIYTKCSNSTKAELLEKLNKVYDNIVSEIKQISQVYDYNIECWYVL